MGRLTGRRALITGASAGIGLATALAFAREGANVIATGRRQQALAELQEAAKGGGEFRILAGDLRERDFFWNSLRPRRTSTFWSAMRDLDLCAAHRSVAGGMRSDVPDQRAGNSAAVPGDRLVSMLARKRGHMIIMSSGAAREVFPLWVRLRCQQARAGGIDTVHATRMGAARDQGVRDCAWHDRHRDPTASTHPAVTAALSARKIRPISAEEIAEAVVLRRVAPENSSSQPARRAPSPARQLASKEGPTHDPTSRRNSSPVISAPTVSRPTACGLTPSIATSALAKVDAWCGAGACHPPRARLRRPRSASRLGTFTRCNSRWSTS